MTLTRESIAAGQIAEIAAEAHARGLFTMMSDEERHKSLEDVLSRLPDGDGWVFGYGSLMWNPAFHYEEARKGLLYGYHRQFCLWTPLGRGTPDCPGLTLALQRGGCCRGMVFRICRTKLREEMDIIWRREMVSGAYRPKILRVKTDGGDIHAVTFVINPSHERYAGRLPPAQAAEAIARARGRIGRCSDYLLNTVEKLHELGIPDRSLESLAADVRMRMCQNTPESS